MASNGKLPKGWQYRPLRDLIESDHAGAWGDAPTGKGDVYVVRSTNLNPDATLDLADVAIRHFPTAKLDKLQLKQGDILLERSGGGPDQPVGRIASFEADGTYVCSNFMQRLRAKSTRCRAGYLKYLLWYFHHCGRTLRLQQRTSGIRNLAYEEYLSSMWPVPPVEQQESITDILSSVDEAIEATRAVIDQTRRLKTALLQDLLTNGLPGRHKKFKKHKFLQRMPTEWHVKPIGEICKSELGKMLSKAVKTGRHYRPYLGNSSVLWGKIDVTNLEMMDIRDDELERYSLKPGDILICEGGEVGRTAIWEGQLELCCYQKALHRLRPHKPNTLVPDFMRFFMEHAVRNNLLVRFTGESSIAHLTRETLVNVPMSLPPFEEQEQIVLAVKSVETKASVDEGIRDQLIQMKSALSQGLLTGRIPVKGGE